SLFEEVRHADQSNPGERDEPGVNKIPPACAAGHANSAKAARSALAQADPPAAFGPIHSSTKFPPVLGISGVVLRKRGDSNAAPEMRGGTNLANRTKIRDDGHDDKDISS